MTSPPVTAATPIYGLEYQAEGEPVFWYRAKWERMVKAVEAALAAGGVAPPGAADLTALTGRVGALEPGAWQTLTLGSGFTALGSGYTPTRVRKLTSKLAQLQFVLSAGTAGGNAVTLPVGFRPVYNTILAATHGTAGTMQVTIVASSGAVQPVAAVSGFLAVNSIFPLD